MIATATCTRTNYYASSDKQKSARRFHCYLIIATLIPKPTLGLMELARPHGGSPPDALSQESRPVINNISFKTRPAEGKGNGAPFFADNSANAEISAAGFAFPRKLFSNLHAVSSLLYPAMIMHIAGGLATVLVLPLLFLLRSLGERTDFIIGKRAGRRAACAAQGLPQVAQIDAIAREPAA